MRSERPGRARRLGAGLLAGAVLSVAAAACGSAGSRQVDVAPATSAAGSPRATISSPSTVHFPGETSNQGSPPSPGGPEAPSPATTSVGAGPCTAADLIVGQQVIGAGTGHYYQAWSLTNRSPSPCFVGPGRPTVRFEDASGRDAVVYQVSELSAPTAAVTIQPGRAAWFPSEELQSTCTATSTLEGGPFHYVVTLPGGSRLRWAPAYLRGPSVVGACRSVELAVGGLSATEPRP